MAPVTILSQIHYFVLHAHQHVRDCSHSMKKHHYCQSSCLSWNALHSAAVWYKCNKDLGFRVSCERRDDNDLAEGKQLIETIWKPPESVRRARGQFINWWRPPIFSSSSAPGRSARWYVFPSIIWHPKSSSWSPARPLIVPAASSYNVHSWISHTLGESIGNTEREREREREGQTLRANGHKQRSFTLKMR